MKLQQYAFMVRYRPGSRNRNADFFSRLFAVADAEGIQLNPRFCYSIIAKSAICEVNCVKHRSSEHDRETIDFQIKVSSSHCITDFFLKTTVRV